MDLCCYYCKKNDDFCMECGKMVNKICCQIKHDRTHCPRCGQKTRTPMPNEFIPDTLSKLESPAVIIKQENDEVGIFTDADVNFKNI